MRVIGFLLATLALTTVCADQTIRITGITGTEGFNLNISGITGVDPTFNVTLGEKITFRIENYFDENGVVPFGLSVNGLGFPTDFSTADMGSLTPSASCVTNSTSLAYAYYVNQTTLEPCILTWTVVAPASGTNFWYTSRSRVYSGVIEVLGLPTGSSGSTTSPPTGTTTSPPTGTTTQAPTTPAPTGSSTGKNDAAVMVPGAAALIIVAINALFA